MNAAEWAKTILTTATDEDGKVSPDMVIEILEDLANE